MDLFAQPDDAPHCLVHDVEGGIRYWPRLLDPEPAQARFAALRDGAQWQQLRRPMYDRVVDVPRLVAAYGLQALSEALPLRALHAAVQARVPAPYTDVGLNLYRDGRDSVAMHHDTLHTLLAPHPIALVSLGAPRRMNLRAKAGARRSIGVELAPGSLLAMRHASQLSHEHGIPKTARPVKPRMSVVFRVRPPPV
ncbi:alpha-ketoglutarate-dependent dioxygenase AlkB [Xanthomonas translucens pv. undulosa]|uniref:alpha-ketoglutarate-dependent dioxygenase AlkB n=1 Tax=Xanthomonas campestris pv. translucens TaxID=343 RepID=UPI003CE743A9